MRYFSSLGSLPFPINSGRDTPCGVGFPIRTARINACCQLPEPFRRLPRPSSPLTAKASTVDAYSLDHITRSCLQSYQSTLNISPNCLNDTSKLGESSDACYVPSCQRAQTRPQRLAGIKSFSVRSYIQKESMVGLGGLEPPT